MRIKVRRRRMPEPPPEYAYAERTPEGAWIVVDGREGAPEILNATQLLAAFEPLRRCPELEKDLEAEASPKAEPAPAKAEAP